jgi:Uma2 family endonuclease
MAEKRKDYFAAGTMIVWDVDLQSPEVIKSYNADDPNNPNIYRRGDKAKAEPALPNWEFPVEILFE